MSRTSHCSRFSWPSVWSGKDGQRSGRIIGAHMDLLIFDLDGTLIDSKKDLVNAVNSTRVHMGMPSLADDTVASYIGNGAPVLIRRALGEQATEDQVKEALEFFIEYYRDHALDFTRLYAGVEP